MKKALLFFLSALLFFAAKAEQVEMVCRANGEAMDMVPLTIDLTKKTAMWGIQKWQVITESEKYITIRTAEHSYTLGGMYWVIDRFSGDFVQTYVGLMSKSGTGTDLKLDGYLLRGVCNKRKF